MYHKVSMVGRRWAPSSTQVPHQRFLQVKFIYFSSICDSCIQYIIYIYVDILYRQVWLEDAGLPHPHKFLIRDS